MKRAARLIHRGVTVCCCTLLLEFLGPHATVGQVRLGLIAGPTYGTMRGDLIPDVEGAFGATLGVHFLFTPATRWMVSVEAQFIQKGGSNVPLAADLVDYRLSFLEMPITIHYAAFVWGEWFVGPHIGFAVGANLGCNFRVGSAFGYSECDRTTPGGEAMGSELGIPFGLSVKRIYPGGSLLVLEARYVRGIAPVLETGDGSASDDVIEIRFGFAIPLTDANN